MNRNDYRIDDIITFARSGISTGGDMTHDALKILADEVESLRKDRIRLDFLENTHLKLNEHYGTNYRWSLILNQNVVRLMAGHPHPSDKRPGIDLMDAQGGNYGLPTCREAIDKKINEVNGKAETSE